MAKKQQPPAEKYFNKLLTWIKDDIEYGYSSEMILNKIKNKNYDINHIDLNSKSVSVEPEVSMLDKLPRCCFLSDAGRRCKKSADFRNNVFLDYETYKKTMWIETNLCREHFLQLGNNGNSKKKKAR